MKKLLSLLILTAALAFSQTPPTPLLAYGYIFGPDSAIFASVTEKPVMDSMIMVTIRIPATTNLDRTRVRVTINWADSSQTVNEFSLYQTGWVVWPISMRPGANAASIRSLTATMQTEDPPVNVQMLQ